MRFIFTAPDVFVIAVKLLITFEMQACKKAQEFCTIFWRREIRLIELNEESNQTKKAGKKMKAKVVINRLSSLTFSASLSDK